MPVILSEHYSYYMFNNVAFNVVIGLVFIYLLYSLLTTIVGEWMSSFLGLRQRILRVGIERMLNDGYNKRKMATDEHKLKAWWSRFIVASPKGFERTFAGRFYDMPSIKYLSRLEKGEKLLFSNSKPSYVSPENFTDTLVTLLSDAGAGNTVMERIGYCLSFNTLHIELETIKHLGGILKDSNKDLSFFKAKLMFWYNETMDRTTGWYKRKLRTVVFWFSLILAISFNIDTIRIAKLLAKDDGARNQLTTMGVALIHDSTKYREFIVADRDSLDSQRVIDSAFNSITKDISTANLVLGLGWDFDTIKIKKSSIISVSNPDSCVIAYAKQQENIKKAEKKLSDDHSAVIALQRRIREEELLTASHPPSSGVRTLEVALLKLAFEQSDDSVVLSNEQAKSATMNVRLVAFTGGDIRTVTGLEVVPVDKKKALRINGIGLLSAGAKFCIFLRILFVDFGWLGFLLTAFALSLGAPFWFGVLNKLVQLRAAGPKPEDEASELTKTNTPQNNQKQLKDIALPEENDIETAVRIYADTIRREQGVIAVGAGYIQIDGKVERCLQVHVKDDNTALVIRTKYKPLNLPRNSLIYINVLVTGDAQLMAGEPKHKAFGIANKTGIHGTGSFGCVLNDKHIKNQFYLLTCFHVANGEASWTSAPKSKIIVDTEKKIVGNDYRHGLDDHHDTAIISINDRTANHYQKLKSIVAEPRLIGFDDVFRTRVFLDGYMSEGESGLIVHDNWHDKFTYTQPSGPPVVNHMTNLLLITKIGDFGDSGSILIDEAGKAVGMLIGSNHIHTYAIKITTILNDFSLEITKPIA